MNRENIKKQMINFYINSMPYIKRMASKGEIPEWLNIFNKLALKVKNFSTPDDIILDVGCGGGWSTFFINKFTSATVIGIDLSLKTVELGLGKKIKVTRLRPHEIEALITKNLLKKHNKIFFTEGDVCDIPFSDKMFNIVFTHGMIEHIPNPELAIKEMLRVLKDNGILVISTCNMLSPFRWLKLFARRIFTGRIHPDSKLKELFIISILNLRKILCYDTKFYYREPVLNYNSFLGSDYDAVYRVNPMDMKFIAKKFNLKIINLTNATSILGKIICKVFPLLSGGVLFIARKTNEKNKNCNSY